MSCFGPGLHGQVSLSTHKITLKRSLRCLVQALKQPNLHYYVCLRIALVHSTCSVQIWASSLACRSNFFAAPCSCVLAGTTLHCPQSRTLHVVRDSDLPPCCLPGQQPH